MTNTLSLTLCCLITFQQSESLEANCCLHQFLRELVELYGIHLIDWLNNRFIVQLRETEVLSLGHSINILRLLRWSKPFQLFLYTSYSAHILSYYNHGWLALTSHSWTCAAPLSHLQYSRRPPLHLLFMNHPFHKSTDYFLNIFAFLEHGL